jgi:pimeloyl-ACP methyl ester carboxylesterase
VLVGHSLGAQVALHCAARHPARVRGLVLILGLAVAGLCAEDRGGGGGPAPTVRAFGIQAF